MAPSHPSDLHKCESRRGVTESLGLSWDFEPGATASVHRALHVMSHRETCGTQTRGSNRRPAPRDGHSGQNTRARYVRCVRYVQLLDVRGTRRAIQTLGPGSLKQRPVQRPCGAHWIRYPLHPGQFRPDRGISGGHPKVIQTARHHLPMASECIRRLTRKVPSRGVGTNHSPT